MTGPINLVRRSYDYDSQQGCWLERGWLTITPALTGTITANLGLECTIDQGIFGTYGTAQLGDALSVNSINITQGESASGARITAAGVGKVKLYNVTGSNITDSVATTYDYELIHYNS